jgi:hypothetical protein
MTLRGSVRTCTRTCRNTVSLGSSFLKRYRHVGLTRIFFGRWIDKIYTLEHKITIMQLLSRVMGAHKLCILGFYTYIIK